MLKLKKLRNSTQGFTIIEVLVVLAIAALILLIVFLAVPALQRSQRNNARRGDAARIAASAIAFVATNNGNLPGFTAGIYAAATATNNLNTIRTDVGTLGQFAFTTVVGNAANTAFPASTNNTLSATSATGALAAIPTSSNDDVYVVMNAVCGVNGAVTTVGATARSIAVQYTLETGTVGQSSPVCQNAQ